MATATKITRTGTVTLRSGYSQGRFQNQSYAVREYADGTLEYYLGAPARTPDGWVSLAEEHRSKIKWSR